MDITTQRIRFEYILNELKSKGNTKVEQGTLFELFCQKVLLTAPFFADDVLSVWLWKDFPGNEGMHDTGIDLVVLDKQGYYWAVQCKFYDRDASVSKADIDSFVAATTRAFMIDGSMHSYATKLVFSTTDKISLNASNLFTTFGPEELLECGIDWESFSLDKIDSMKPRAKKKPKEHQIVAINDVMKGFETCNRGKLIMACGTGKTYTSLKIVEKIFESTAKSYNDYVTQFNVLYLVPSIALLSQTILEWKTQEECSTSSAIVRAFGVCSDITAGKESRKKERDEMLVQMPIPATTDVGRLLSAYENPTTFLRHINLFFSTYQSIDVISDFCKKSGVVFDIAVCDEAHRTIGAYKDDSEDLSDFVKIHKDEFVPCKKRLYMTATEKIYSSNAKQEAKDVGWSVYSMDDPEIYGPRFHYLSFGAAVTQQLLTDYRLLVLNIRKSDVAKLNLPASTFENLDDAARIVGSLTAISKIPSEHNPDEFAQDPKPMKRSVTFCSTIAQAKSVALSFNRLSDEKCLGREYMEDQGFVIPKAKLITGQNNTSEKNKMLDWLRGDIEDGTCHILTNARCLSEGVDVPSLDSVVFIAKKRSQVDIIQAVGRVMRKFGSGTEKKYGYIIIPVVINDEKLTDQTLSNSEEYKVVWQVVQALRSHDERLDTQINKIGVTGQMPECLCFINTFIPPKSKHNRVVGSLRNEMREGLDSDNPVLMNPTADFTISIPSDEELQQNEQLFSAQLVKHCGNRLYWEDWSKNIGDITNNVALKIQTQITTDERTTKAFSKFLANFRRLLNPAITESDAINMLAEHVVTLPVLKVIFAENDLIDNNPVTKIMEAMVKKLKNIASEIEGLKPFYESVAKTVEGVTSSEGRQEIIRKLFEKFFRYALPSSAEKFGIVYTPVEVVDFIINSVNDVLNREFKEQLTTPGIKIIDPFTGTGTFIIRLLDKLKELGISNEDLQNKYRNDIWCNEIMLLAYYIALINIEDTYGKLNGEFEAFSHAVLTDTFQMAEKKKSKFFQNAMFEEEEFEAENTKAKEESAADIRIIIANPPYSVGQRSANDNNANNPYPNLDERIRTTYAQNVKIQNKNAIYDSYVRSFRWASDRIGDDGIISFVSNGSYVDNLAFSGFRRELLKEFNHVYIYNLRGNCRTSGELRRKEAGNIFGEGSRTLICIIVLIKHKGQPLDGFIHYKDIGDYLTREQKLKIVAETGSIANIDWEQIYPDKNNDWLNKKDDKFDGFLCIGCKDKCATPSVFSSFYSRGIATGKDAWMYNFSASDVEKNCGAYIDFYNEEQQQLCKLFSTANSATEKIKIAKKEIIWDSKKIKWDDDILSNFIANRPLYRNQIITTKGSYRPFCKKHLCYYPDITMRTYRWLNLFPDTELENYFISVPGIGNKKDFSVLITSSITDLGFQSATQVFPLYWYEAANEPTSFLDEFESFGQYKRKCAISENAMMQFRERYNNPLITSEDVFYYIYGVFHSKEYAARYASNLQKDLPRIPLLAGFDKYAEIGRKLAALHLNYESAEPYSGVQIEKRSENYTVSKIRYLAKERKDVIIFNDQITIKNVPLEAYNYVVNGRSPIDWVLDQYQYTVDAESGIVDDPNLYDKGKGGKYIFDLILSLITVSLETQRLIAELPKYEEI